MIPVDQKHQRQNQLRSVCKIIHQKPVYSYISLYLEGEGFRNRLALHMHIIIEPAFLNIFVFVFLLEYMNGLTRQIKSPFHTQYEIKICRRIQTKILINLISCLCHTQPLIICLVSCQGYFFLSCFFRRESSSY